MMSSKSKKTESGKDGAEAYAHWSLSELSGKTKAHTWWTIVDGSPDAAFRFAKSIFEKEPLDWLRGTEAHRRFDNFAAEAVTVAREGNTQAAERFVELAADPIWGKELAVARKQDWTKKVEWHLLTFCRCLCVEEPGLEKGSLANEALELLLGELRKEGKDLSHWHGEKWFEEEGNGGYLMQVILEGILSSRRLEEEDALGVQELARYAASAVKGGSDKDRGWTGIACMLALSSGSKALRFMEEAGLRISAPETIAALKESVDGPDEHKEAGIRALRKGMELGWWGKEELSGLMKELCGDADGRALFSVLEEAALEGTAPAKGKGPRKKRL